MTSILDSDSGSVTVKGKLYDGVSATAADTILTVYETGQVLITSGVIKKKRHISSLTISRRTGDSPRYIDLPEGSRFETRDNESVDKIAAGFSKNRSELFVAWLENSKWIFTVLLLIVVAAAYSAVKWGIPALAEKAADQIPLSILVSVDELALKSLDEEYTSPSELSSEEKAGVKKIFRETVSWFDNSNYSFNLQLRKGGRIGANAFALPGGTIIITDELVNMSRRPEELKGIIAHETGHIVMRHSARTVLQNSAVILIISTVVGDVSSLSSVISAIPTLLISGKYSRDFEREADNFSLEYMNATGIDPINLVNILERISSSHEGLNIPDILSTHPSTEERKELLINNNS